MMNLLSVENLEKTVKDEPLFTNLTFGLEEKDKVGIVGRNGAGKSTLLRILAGRMHADEGKISMKNGTVVSFLEQNVMYGPGETVGSYFFKADNPYLDKLKEYDEAIAAGDEKTYTRLYDEIERENLWDLERSYHALLEEFSAGCGPDDMVENLSGGQQKKMALARALSLRADLILLDEPTNHLDIKTIEKLEDMLVKTDKTVMIVTHDRHILNTVCSTIFELDRSSFFLHPGSFQSYLERRTERISMLQKEQDRIKKILERELKWLSRGPKARTGKDRNRKDRIDSMLDMRQDVQDEKQKEFSSLSRRLGKKILEIDGIGKSYGDRKLFSGFSFSFVKGMRIGLVGDNGSGKSTLLDIMTGKLAPDEGFIDTGVNTVFGYYDQAGRELNGEKTVMEYILDIAEKICLADGEIVSAARFLELFGFPQNMHRSPINLLSGGERRRLYLISILVRNPNFLVLDEPTNDLDLATMENLEDYCTSFQGCLVICSHDRTFLDITTDMLFVIEDGKILLYPGHYSEWKEWKKEKEEEEKRLQTAEKEKKDSRPSKEKKGLSYKEKKEKESLEQEIAALEGEKAALEASFSTIPPDDFKTLNENTLRYNEVGRLIDEKTSRWLYLEDMDN